MATGGSIAKADQDRGYHSGVGCLPLATNRNHPQASYGQEGSYGNRATDELLQGEHRYSASYGYGCRGAEESGPTGRRDVAQTGIQAR